MNTLQDLATVRLAVSADYLNQRLLQAARGELLEAMKWLHFQRILRAEVEFPDLWQAAVARRHRAADRVWEAQCMAQGVFG